VSRIVSWFSCGDASAVTTKIVLAEHALDDVAVARILVPEEHEDNDRFAADCERWFGVPIINLKSSEYSSCEDVWSRTRYMSGPQGARCTSEMKKAVRHDFERAWQPDFQAFGYTVEEKKRVRNFLENNPEVRLKTPLVDKGLTKDDCHAIVSRAGIEIPAMYRLGFNNNNCIGCVKAQSPTYWNRVRRQFPDVFARRAQQSRELGVRLVKGTSGARERIFLDELDPALGAGDMEPSLDCGLLCQLAEEEFA